MSTVFTNDINYLSARDDLITVIFKLFYRKLQDKVKMETNCLLIKSERD